MASTQPTAVEMRSETDRAGALKFIIAGRLDSTTTGP